jgi:periplasmic protein TonB
VFHLDDLGPPAPRLPQRRWQSAVLQLAVSATAHTVAACVLIVFVVAMRTIAPATAAKRAPATAESIDTSHIVFIARDPLPIGGGGGGGGNRQAGPIRHAEGIGTDAITLRVAKPAPRSEKGVDLPSPLAQVLLDAKPLASGTFNQVGLPTGGVSFGTSTGPGTGGGVGDGFGTGIGSGRGPGIGPGSGGGTGGGVYRPGGSVSAPRVLIEVKPAYSSDALRRRVQGSVFLELVVMQDGCPSQIRVTRSLDPGGLDEQAIAAASQWRFEPGRLAGAPVDVLVTLVLDFSIR